MLIQYAVLLIHIINKVQWYVYYAHFWRILKIKDFFSPCFFFLIQQCTVKGERNNGREQGMKEDIREISQVGAPNQDVVTWYVPSLNEPPWRPYVYYFKGCSTCTLHVWVVVHICQTEHTVGCVHAIKCVNKRDVHVAQSAIAQTETINHKCMVSRIALFLVPEVLSLGWNYTALYLQHCIFLDFVLTLHRNSSNTFVRCHVFLNHDERWNFMV